jgi:hypothetical protein
MPMFPCPRQKDISNRKANKHEIDGREADWNCILNRINMQAAFLESGIEFHCITSVSRQRTCNFTNPIHHARMGSGDP